MKQFLLIAMLVIFTTACFGQEAATSPTRAEYLQKSRNQKTAAWILLGAGVTMFAIAAPGNVSFGTLGALVVAGSAATLGSIPLFLAAGRNKRKAAKASAYFKFEKLPSAQPGFAVLRIYPAVSLKIHL